MIYDKLLIVCDPPEGFGAPFHGKLLPRSRHWYADLTVFHRRFWEAAQAGTKVHRMVQIPFGQEIMATSYAILGDRRLYRIEEAQPTTDEDGLPVTNLTLSRMEKNYELCKPDDSP